MATPVIATKDKNDIDYEEWMESLTDYKILRKDLNSLVMDYFIKEGFKEVAQKFEMESGSQPNIDLHTLNDQVEIRNMIEKGLIDSAIQFINNKYPELFDDNKYIFFQLQQQQLVELIRQKQIEEALVFAQNNLAEFGEKDPGMLDQLEKTLALLAFDEPEKSPFGDLLSHNHRQKIASDVIHAIAKFNISNEGPYEPNLSNILKFLLWCQSELTHKKIVFPKMTDLEKGTIPNPNESQLPTTNTTIEKK